MPQLDNSLALYLWHELGWSEEQIHEDEQEINDEEEAEISNR